MGNHINKEGLFQSDKYPTCPPGKVPLSVEDKSAQDLLWTYAQRRRAIDAEFSEDLETALTAAGYQPWLSGVEAIALAAIELERARKALDAAPCGSREIIALRVAYDKRRTQYETALAPFLEPEPARAAVTIVQREKDQRILCVWNKRYSGWACPGGKVEKGETPYLAAERELQEETSLLMISAVEVYAGMHGKSVESTRGSIVHVFLAGRCGGEPKESEIGCAVTWLTIDEFLRWSPFAEFYKPIFEKLRADRRLK